MVPTRPRLGDSPTIGFTHDFACLIREAGCCLTGDIDLSERSAGFISIYSGQ